jgi:hypothetical protein
MRFTEVIKHFWSPEATNYFLATFILELKAKYQLEVSENKFVNFFLLIGVRGPMKSIHETPSGPRTPGRERLF